MYPQIFLLLENWVCFSWKDSKIALHVPSVNGDPSHQHNCTVVCTLHPNESQINGHDNPFSILVALALGLLLIYTALSNATVIGLAKINTSLVKSSSCSDWSGNPMARVLEIHFQNYLYDFVPWFLIYST